METQCLPQRGASDVVGRPEAVAFSLSKHLVRGGTLPLPFNMFCAAACCQDTSSPMQANGLWSGVVTHAGC